MRKAEVYFNDKVAGYLFENNGKYFFKYDEQYLINDNPAISLTLPKSKNVFISKYLFPFFFGILPEGENIYEKDEMQNNNHIDYFDILVTSAGKDAIGGITVKGI